MTHKQSAIKELAAHIHSLGYTVYLAESGEYGFFVTPNNHVCSFEMNYGAPHFSGNYASNGDGTGWGITTLQTLAPTAEQLERITASADELPRFSPTAWKITTEQYLARSAHSKYKLYEGAAE